MILVLLSFFSLLARADLNTKTEAFWTTRYRSFDSTPFAKYNYDHFLYLKQELSYSNEDWHFQTSPFALVVNSQPVSRVSQASDPILTSIFSNRQKMNLQTKMDQDEYTHTVLDFQELFTTYSHEALSAQIGRRIISLGNLKLLPGWNKFNPTGASFRPTWLKGVDHLKLSWQNENSKISGYAMGDQNPAYEAHLLQLDHFVSPFQISLLGGTWWEATSFGLALTADVEGWLLKLEALQFDYLGDSKIYGTETQWGGGFERSFAQEWTANFEFLFQSSGAKKKEDYPTHLVSQHQSLRGQAYTAGEIKWTPNPFYTYSALVLYSLVDQSSLQGLTIAKQWNENTEVSLGAFLPAGDGEFSPDFKIVGLRAYTGAPSQIDLTVKIFY